MYLIIFSSDVELIVSQGLSSGVPFTERLSTGVPFTERLSTRVPFAERLPAQVQVSGLSSRIQVTENSRPVP